MWTPVLDVVSLCMGRLTESANRMLAVPNAVAGVLRVSMDTGVI